MQKNKRLILFITMLVLGAAAMLAYSALTGNTNQKFTDIVIEFTAMDGSNKSAERSLFYIFAIVGALIYGFIFLLGKWGCVKDEPTNINGIDFIIAGLGTSLVTNLVVYKSVSWVVVTALALAVVARIKGKPVAVGVMAFFFVAIYAIVGVYRALVFAGMDIPIKLSYVAIAAVVMSLVVLLFNENKGILRGILCAQLFIPLSLLVYLASDYAYAGDVTSIRIPNRVKLLIFAIIVIFVCEAIVRIRNAWNDAESLDDVLGFGTCVSIMAFNRFSGSGAIISSDLHHPFENIIGYSQMFELGQKAFSQYIPVSGMYSVIHGFFLKLFGHGYAGYYHLSTNIFYLAIIFIIVFLLRRQLKAEWVLVVSLVFLVTDYNRVALIVPIILLLAWPKLIEKKNLWLKAWFLTSFVHALYYPVFGAAVCFGFLPLGIWQIYSYAKSGDLAKDVKTVRFWAWWIVCCIPVLGGMKLLIGTAKHMLAMGSQTIYADGIARFGQAVPENFLSYIPSLPVRLGAYYIISYLLMISIIWLSVALFLRSGNAVARKLALKMENPESACIAISIGLMLLISFSYTVVRFDYFDIYSRSDGVIRAAFVVLIILIARYLKKDNRNVLPIFVFTIFIISAVSGEGFLKLDADEKLAANYTVPDGYVYTNSAEPRFGECFVEEDTYSYVMRTNDYLNTLGKDQSYMGIVDSFGLFYLCDIKGDSAMEILNTIKGYGAVEETLDIIRDNNTIVGMNISPLRNYYFYHWLVTSGEYTFDNENVRLFIPNVGGVAKEDILEQNKNINLFLSYETDNLGLIAGSFGSSMESLEPVFTEKDYGYALNENEDGVSVDFASAFDGDDADFMYLEFDTDLSKCRYGLYNNHFIEYDDEDASQLSKSLMKKFYNDGVKVVVSWKNDAGEIITSSCDMDEGKLLFPLGAARGWLLNSHSSISISVMADDEVIATPKITDLRMLKLREVE